MELLMRDVRLAKASELEATARAAEAPRCAVCDRRLPHGVRRAHCLEHSEYAQRVMARVRRTRSRRPAARRVA